MTKGASKVTNIARRLDAIMTAGLKIQALCPDQEYYASEVIEFLATNAVPVILQVRIHGRVMKQVPNGTHSRP